MSRKNKTKPPYILRPKQRSAKFALTDPSLWHIKLIAYGGAAEGGKSFLAADWLIDMCMDKEFTNLKYSACAVDIEKSKATIQDKINEVATLKGLVKDVHYTYNKNDHEFTFLATGSRIVLFGLPKKKDNEWLRGYEWTGSWVDESDTIDEAVLKAHYKRVGRYNNTILIPMEEMTDQEKIDNPQYEEYKGYDKLIVPKKLLETFNPTNGHPYTRFYIPWRDKTQLTLKEPRLFIRSYVYDNYAENSERIKDMENEPEGIEKDKSFYGRFDINYSEKAIFKSEQVNKLFTQIAEHTGEKSAIIDVSSIGTSKDSTAIGIWNGLDMYYHEELNRFKTFEDLRDYIVSLLLKHDVRMANVVIDANGVGNMLISSEKFKGAKSFMAHNSVIKEETGNINMFKKGRNILSKKYTGRYRRLKDQCTVMLSDYVNDGLMSVSVNRQNITDTIKKELLIYELIANDNDIIQVTPKSTFRRLNQGKSPDTTDLMVMRMFLILLEDNLFKPKPRNERKFIKNKKTTSNYV